MLPPLIFLGFYSPLQAQIVTRSVNLKLSVTVVRLKPVVISFLLFISLLFPLLFSCFKFV